jgi:hypothetical protein
MQQRAILIFIYTFLQSEGWKDEACEPSIKRCSFENWGALNRKKLPLFKIIDLTLPEGQADTAWELVCFSVPPPPHPFTVYSLLLRLDLIKSLQYLTHIVGSC